VIIQEVNRISGCSCQGTKSEKFASMNLRKLQTRNGNANFCGSLDSGGRKVKCSTGGAALEKPEFLKI